MNVLMIAYACNPEGSGEHWLGWGWAEQAAKEHRVTLLTTSFSREAIERHSRRCGITPHFVEIPDATLRRFRRFAKNQNVVHQFLWQQNVLPLAERLHAERPFDLIHQTTFHSFRVPFLASRLPIPSLWGPMAGGESVPKGFERFLGPKRRSEAIRAAINAPCLWVPPVRAALNRSTALWVSNHVTKAFLPRKWQEKTSVVAPNALRPEDATLPERRVDPTLRPLSLLYVGNCVATRSIPLVLEALERTKLEPGWKLNIIGEGPAIPHWKEETARRNLGANVHFIGPVPRAALDDYYKECHALVFPGLRDSGGSSLLEAMSKGVPVVCLDWAGPAEMVDAESAIRIPVHEPEETLCAMAAAFERLPKDPTWAEEIGRKAQRRVRSHFSWEEKGKLLLETYRRLVQK